MRRVPKKFFILHSSLLILFVLYYLCHELSFADYFLTYEYVSFHGGYAAADRSQQFYTEYQCVAWHYLLAELHAVYL